MNKKELVAAVAAKAEITQASAEKVLKALPEVTVAEVAKKGKLLPQLFPHLKQVRISKMLST